MTFLRKVYSVLHPHHTGPYPCWTSYSLWRTVWKPFRKFCSAVLIPMCPFSFLRILGYRMCGYKIGRNCFVGMRCYLDDLCYDSMIIDDNVTVSYGVYFACHGKGQGHNKIIIRKGAYIGMRASIITPSGDVEIGENAIVGAAALVNKSIPSGVTAVGVPIRFL